MDVYKECQLDWMEKNVKTRAGQFYQTPKIGILTVDYDDESAAQMGFIEKFINKFTNNTFSDNVGEMYLTYMTAATTGKDQCKPIIRIFEEEITCLIN